MKRLVVMQPQFFPWVGYLEQIRLADVFVFGDTFSLPGNSSKNFYNRVQIKTATGTQWLTVPVDRKHSVSSLGPMNRMRIQQDGGRWCAKHLKTLRTNYAPAPFAAAMFELVEAVYARADLPVLSELNMATIRALAVFFDLCAGTTFLRLSEMEDLPAGKTERLVAMAERVGADEYVTGRGALDYLEPDRFAEKGIRVSVMEYARMPYPQRFGAFTPYVSSLDLVANLGPAGRDRIVPRTRPFTDARDADGGLLPQKDAS